MSGLVTDLKGVSHISNSTLMSELESSIKMWLDWGFLRIGAWADVNTPSTPNGYGGNFARLRLVDDPSFSAGQVWEAARKDWVWESNVNYVDLNDNIKNPKTVSSTVLVNNVATPYSWIDYPLGRVYFSTPINTSATVLVSYSYRWLQIYRGSIDGWWKDLQYRSFRVDDSIFHTDEGGGWVINGQHRVQMPCLVIEVSPRATSKPYQLGDGSVIINQDISIYVIAESAEDRNRITDILRGQFDKTIWLFNSNEISENDDWPLDYRGMVIDNTKTYPALVDENTGYRWAKCRFVKSEVLSITSFHSRLYISQVKLTGEVVLPD